ncbi:MAG: pterin-4-alpha-carbinolamine dehydratase [Azospirillum sp.]|nr:pterin-4-alpha-carbinolamine dehydratase [Azospirillum sp.]
MAAEGLIGKQCEPCRGGIPPLERAEAKRYLAQVSDDWSLTEAGDRIDRTFKFANFIEAQTFAAMVGTLCEAEGHHPEIRYGWGYCEISFWTHKIKGLHENDFIMAAKVDNFAAVLGFGG